MINKDFIEKIEQLAMPERFDIKDDTYIRDGVYGYRKVRPESFPSLCVRSLTGLLDYISEGIDEMESPFLHVMSPTVVRLFGKVGADKYRDEYMAAATDDCQFGFGNYFDHESFIVRLSANFVRNEMMTTLLQAVSTMKHEKVGISEDDSISQKLTVREGISRTGSVKIENPVTLRPFSTFSEIEQPERDFILRLTGGGERSEIKLALFEMDGRTWEGATMSRIKVFLVKSLDELAANGKLDRKIPVIA